MSFGRIRARALVVLLAVATAPPATAGAQTAASPITASTPSPLVQSAITASDSLFMGGDANGAMALLDARLDADPNDFEALWRAARAALAIGILSGSGEREVRWLEEASGYGDRLLALRPADTLSLQWAAATKGLLAIEGGSPFTKVRLGKEVWALTDTLLRMRPDNALGNDVRGRFMRELLVLPRASRFIARYFLGFDPVGRASWAGSEAYLKRAVASDPTVIYFYLDLGDTYLKQGKDAEALEVYRKGVVLPSLYPVDEHYRRDLRSRIQDLEGRGVGTP